MGMFLSMTSVVGKGQEAVAGSLANYMQSAGGGLAKEELPLRDEHCFVILEENGNTSIFHSFDFMEWDEASTFISKDLATPVFSFHIHDGDLWMYNLFVNGVEVDRFNPLPDYWEENLDTEEIASWAGDATVVAQYVPGLSPVAISNYLVRWDLESDGVEKAYEGDVYGQEDWQLLDFMRKLRLPYPLDEQLKPLGDTYKGWTKELRIKIQPPRKAATEVASAPRVIVHAVAKKPWWKFW
ncbi:hypothetical protein [Paraflavitalea pollutisoli]|uniref:hypothetical protein n=1 Tax=Paraflavitalea pollutisoli TaxID=3034143 RepID=UPI0023ECEE54|nr:hypothetical protein [Paraflavitalea sp. H1-2-19X]